MANMRVAVHCAVSSASPDSSFGMIFLDCSRNYSSEAFSMPGCERSAWSSFERRPKPIVQ
jgi:hypothetical protein